jgi:nicotinamidase-related amidase
MANNGHQRALLVVDVQNEYVTGKLVIEFPPIATSLCNIAKAMDAALKRNVHVLVATQVLSQDAPVFADGTEGAHLHQSIEVKPRSHLFVRKHPRIFSDPSLSAWLQENSIETVTVVGYITQILLDNIVCDALRLGIAVEFLADAGGSVPCRNRAGTASAEEIHRVLSVVLHCSSAAVLPTDEWIQMLDSGMCAERDNILNSNRRALLTRAQDEHVRRDV